MLVPSGCLCPCCTLWTPLICCEPQVFADGATDQSLVVEIVVRAQPALGAALRAAGTKRTRMQETLAAEGEASARLAFDDLADTNEATSRLLTSTAPLRVQSELWACLSSACKQLNAVL